MIEIGGDLSQCQNIYIYNAALSGQTWKNTSGMAFIKNHSPRPHQNFSGVLHFEDFSGGPFELVDSACGGPIVFLSTVGELNQTMTLGNAFFVESFASNITGVPIGLRKPWKLAHNMVVKSGETILGPVPFLNDDAYKVLLTAVKTNSPATPAAKVLEFTVCYTQGVKACGPVVKQFDYYGGNLTDPVISVNEGSQLVVTCGADWDDTDIIVNATLTQIGLSSVAKF